MDTLMSLPMTASVLTEYGDLEEACRSCGCDGLEVVWGGEELPCTVPQALHVGYHLTFYPDWLDFWRGDRAALTEKFGSEEGGPFTAARRDGRPCCASTGRIWTEL